VRETQRPSANILIPLRLRDANLSKGDSGRGDVSRSARAIKRAMVARGFLVSSFLASCVLCLCVPPAAKALQSAQQAGQPAQAPKRTTKGATARKKRPAAIPAKPPVASSLAEQQLERLARDLHEHPIGMAYERLTQFAEREKGTAIGARAALALGYYDYTRAHFTEARSWLEKAAADPLLPDYALFWEAQNDRAAGAVDIALVELKRFRQRYPDVAMNDSAVEALAQAAIAAGQPGDAVAALQEYSRTTTKPSLLLLRAQAKEKAAVAKGEKPLSAASDYLDVIYRFPVNDEAKTAVERIPYLQAILGEQFPGTPVETEINRAEALYDARRWRDVRKAYEDLLPKLSGVQRDRAELRLAQVQIQLGGSPDALGSLKLTDPELDAERIYSLSQVQRSAKLEAEMFAAIEQVVSTYPQSPWAEEALFAAGNYYWLNLDRSHAAEYYERILSAFPTGKYASIAQWRIAWTSYMLRQPEAASRFEQFLTKYPTSPQVANALYWLGRCYEHTGNTAHARSFYLAAVARFPQTYFGEKAAQRLHEIGTQPTNPADILSAIPPASPLAALDGPLPAAATQRWARAQALQSIAFDSSAELELRSAYADTHAGGLLLAIAKAAEEAGHYGAGILATRQIVTQFEARRVDEIPDEALRTAYPLPYRDLIERESQRYRLDPMLVAGLIRQESAFASDAVSYANAVGLMQLWPPTATKLARSLKFKYARGRLFDPEYNVRLGTLYLSDLLRAFGTPEAALAAYNAGENHVEDWSAGQNYQETAEFVESIPITQTREYVQIVARNAELYRQIYRRGAATLAKTSPAAAPASDSDTPAVPALPDGVRP
jgi:peptidoglycan lytic transglycosylase